LGKKWEKMGYFSSASLDPGDNAFIIFRGRFSFFPFFHPEE